MAKESTMQLRMDSEMKEQVEALYRRMGTSFAEAIRIFAAKSLLVNGLPFEMNLSPAAGNASVNDLAGSLRGYATPEKLAGEAAALQEAFARAALEKHGERTC
jgi:DNA-damage-inducible protein J